MVSGCGVGGGSGWGDAAVLSPLWGLCLGWLAGIQGLTPLAIDYRPFGAVGMGVMVCGGLRWVIVASLCAVLWAGVTLADDQPQWGERNTRNMVSAETGLPDSFDVGYRSAVSGEPDLATTENVKWVVRLGRETHGTPVIAGGKVLVGTNNDSPRDERLVDDAGVLMCFGEESGEFLWQLVVPKLVEIENADWFNIGLCSTPAVEGDRAYLVTNRCEVVCLDMRAMANGNDGPYLDEGRHMVPAGIPPIEPGPADADIIWLYDMVGELDVRPHNSSNCSVIVHGDHLYVCTSNGPVEFT